MKKVLGLFLLACSCVGLYSSQNALQPKEGLCKKTYATIASFKRDEPEWTGSGLSSTWILLADDLKFRELQSFLMKHSTWKKYGKTIKSKSSKHHMMLYRSRLNEGEVQAVLNEFNAQKYQETCGNVVQVQHQQEEVLKDRKAKQVEERNKEVDSKEAKAAAEVVELVAERVPENVIHKAAVEQNQKKVLRIINALPNNDITVSYHALGGSGSVSIRRGASMEGTPAHLLEFNIDRIFIDRNPQQSDEYRKKYKLSADAKVPLIVAHPQVELEAERKNMHAFASSTNLVVHVKESPEGGDPDSIVVTITDENNKTLDFNFKLS